mmetsp:Transcript_93373/g.146852  ORF Transcript_93373/g.146852 Transcript_93373/m.146852 type:complete len:97 (+) Transcript_93373:351-641(+)
MMMLMIMAKGMVTRKKARVMVTSTMEIVAVAMVKDMVMIMVMVGMVMDTSLVKVMGIRRAEIVEGCCSGTQLALTSAMYSTFSTASFLEASGKIRR